MWSIAAVFHLHLLGLHDSLSASCKSDTILVSQGSLAHSSCTWVLQNLLEYEYTNSVSYK